MGKAKEIAPPASRRVFRVDPDWVENRRKNRAFQWVPMDDDRWVCVWSAQVGDAFRVMAAGIRPGPMEEFGPDHVGAIRMQIATACHDGEPPNGTRIFGDNQLAAVDLLSPAEMNRILAAYAELNGTDPETVEMLESFAKRNGGDS